MLTLAALDFGYPWWLDYGHLAIALPVIALLGLGYWRKWSKGSMLILALAAFWASTVFLLLHFGLGLNTKVPALPTQSFFRSGTGRVLDLGAGTGRSSIMVLAARPQAKLVASDLFGDSFDQHFGHDGTPEQRLFQNLQAAGVERRVTIVRADMRKLPFEAKSFDALVSAYALDHLNRGGIGLALAEAARVVKPGGDFLLILVANDGWAKIAFGPLLSHGGTRGKDWWTEQLQAAGFRVTEDGKTPATLYLLSHRSTTE